MFRLPEHRPSSLSGVACRGLGGAPAPGFSTESKHLSRLLFDGKHGRRGMLCVRVCCRTMPGDCELPRGSERESTAFGMQVIEQEDRNGGPSAGIHAYMHTYP